MRQFNKALLGILLAMYVRKCWWFSADHTGLIDNTTTNHAPQIETLTFCFVMYILNKQNE
jgi:hypothetical protein